MSRVISSLVELLRALKAAGMAPPQRIILENADEARRLLEMVEGRDLTGVSVPLQQVVRHGHGEIELMGVKINWPVK